MQWLDSIATLRVLTTWMARQPQSRYDHVVEASREEASETRDPLDVLVQA